MCVAVWFGVSLVVPTVPYIHHTLHYYIILLHYLIILLRASRDARAGTEAECSVVQCSVVYCSVV